MDSSLRQWLRRAVQPHVQPDRLFRDVEAALMAYPSLNCKTDNFTHEDGRHQVLLCLYGTLPVTFRSVTYNIPISIWLPTAYPHTAPIIYVEPTKDMLVKPSAHVDTGRRVNHPYLSYWPTRAEQSSIVEIATILQSVFSQAPPLYTRPDPRRTTPSPGAGGAGEAGGSGPSAQLGLRQIHGQRPPSYHGMSSEFAPVAMPSPNIGARIPATQSYSDFAAGSAAVTPATPIPVPTPAAASTSGPSLPYYTQPLPLTSIPSSSGAPPASAALLAMPVPTTGVPAALGYPLSLRGAANASPSRTPTSSDATLLHTSRSPLPGPTRQQLLTNALRERLSAMIAHFNMKMNADMEALLVANKGLNEAEATIEKNRGLLLDFETKAKANVAAIQNKTERLDKFLEYARTAPETPVDELVTTTSVAHTQLFDLAADEHAIEDTVYHLGQAMIKEGRLDLDAYLKHIRQLSREQFMRRALVAKIQATAGLSLAQDRYPKPSPSYAEAHVAV